MQVRNFRVVEGKFDSLPILGDPGHRRLATDIAVEWEARYDGDRPWRKERAEGKSGEKWDGNSRPDFIGWLIPRWGVNSLASFFHDQFFGDGHVLSDGTQITRKEADLVFLEAMKYSAAERVNVGWKAPAQLFMADVMYNSVTWFGGGMWNAHDFRRG